MKRGIRRWIVSLKWQGRKTENRDIQVETFKKAVESLEKTFGLRITADCLKIEDPKTGKIWDWKNET